MPHLINSSTLTGKRQRVAWWCWCGKRIDGHLTECPHCTRRLYERNAQVSASERTVFYRHPLTGEIRRPARSDQPMDPKYEAQGYVREEVMSMIQHERETGSIHEGTTWNAGNEPSPERDPVAHAPKEVLEKVINEVRAAHQSGPWTLDSPLMDAPRES